MCSFTPSRTPPTVPLLYQAIPRFPNTSLCNRPPQHACPTQLLQHLTLSSPANYESLSSPARNDKTTFSAHPQDKSCTLDHTNKHDVTCTQHVNTLQFFPGQSAPTAQKFAAQHAYQKFAAQHPSTHSGNVLQPFSTTPASSTQSWYTSYLYPLLNCKTNLKSTQLEHIPILPYGNFHG